jgi:hypothetical protein
LVQVPSVFASAHDWQAPPHGELQQYPWAQVSPAWHSAVAPQTAPWLLSPHEFGATAPQVLGLLHCRLLSQESKQTGPLQT